MDEIETCEQEDEFLFESSHLALRGNLDFVKVMRHLAVLCAKRIQVREDIDLLAAAQNKARENPLKFAEQLREGSLNLPQSIIIPEIPAVDFSKYDFENLDQQETGESNTPSSSQDKAQGIIYWTLDEQRKLEELLDKFPPEAIESQRYAKIAKVMGNRTPKQIASRVQKFFKKLHEANLPIPGSIRPTRRTNKSKKHKFNLERPTTFFPERIIPSELMMRDDCDEDSDDLTQTMTRQQTVSSDQRTLELLKLVRSEKVQRSSFHPSSNTIASSKCSSCNRNGSELTCYDCDRIIFCGDCVVFQLSNKSFVHLHHNVRQI